MSKVIDSIWDTPKPQGSQCDSTFPPGISRPSLILQFKPMKIACDKCTMFLIVPVPLSTGPWFQREGIFAGDRTLSEMILHPSPPSLQIPFTPGETDHRLQPSTTFCDLFTGKLSQWGESLRLRLCRPPVYCPLNLHPLVSVKAISSSPSSDCCKQEQEIVAFKWSMYLSTKIGSLLERNGTAEPRKAFYRCHESPPLKWARRHSY